MSDWRRAVPPHVAASLAAILAVGVAARVWAVNFGLPYTQARPDETMIIDVVLGLLRGGPLPTLHDYPWLFMYLSACANGVRYLTGALTGTFLDLPTYVASWPLNWEPFFLINRGFSVAFGSATVLAVFAIGRRLGGDGAGVTAALLLAVSFLHVRESHYGTTDATMTFFIVVSVALLMRAFDEDSARWFAAAGVAAGLAAGSKYNAILLGVPIVCAQVLVLLPGPRRRIARWPIVYAGVPFALVFLACVPFVYFDFERFREAMVALWQSMAAGHSGGPPPDSGWVYHTRLSLRHGVGLPVLAVGVAGTVVAAWRNWRAALLVLSFPAMYFLVIGFSRNVFFRYTLPIVPFLCVTAGLGIAVAADQLLRRGPGLRTAAALAVAAVIAWPSMTSIWAFNRILGRTDNRVLVQQFIETAAAPGSSIVQSGSMYGHAHFRRELGFRRWVWDKGRRAFVVDGQRAEGRPDWILIQDSPLPSLTQPIVLEWLREGYAEVRQFRALDLGLTGNLYDRQDAFFVPYAGFQGVERPGPNFTIYRRAD